MSTTIETLELEIKSNSANAVSGINALTQSLEKLRNATKGGLGLGSVASGISKVANAVNSINASTLSNLSGLTNAISLLAGIKISSNIGKRITEMAAAIDKLDVKAFSSKIDKIVKSLKPLATQLQIISNAMVSVQKNSKNVTTNVGKMTKTNNMGGLSFLVMGGKIGMAYMAIKSIVSGIYGFIEKSSDYIENVNLFTVAMGSYAEEAKAYANTVSEVMGIDPGEWMRNQGVFQTLATGFGVANDKAAIMSKNLTQLGYDISSFFNLDITEAMEKLQSGLAGELEPLRRIGYDLSQAKLQATALELGIDKSVSSMTQAEKAMLRYYAIMTQVTTVHGDMARTLDAPANQIRIFKAQLEMLGREIGNVFIPILNKILPYLIATTKILREIISGIATLVGFEMPEVDYSGVDAATGVAEDTETALDGATESAKKLKSYMMGFDELNVINPDEGSASSADTSSAFDIELPEYDFLGNATSERIDGIISKIKEMFAPIKELIDITVEWSKSLDLEPMSESLGSFAESVKNILGVIGDVLSWLHVEVVLPIIKWLVESGLPALLEALSNLNNMISSAVQPLIDGFMAIKPVLEPIVSWIGDVFVAVVEGLGEIFSEVGNVFEEKGGTIRDTIVRIGEIIAGIWAWLKPILDLIIPFIKKLASFIGKVLGGVIGGLIDVVKGVVDFIAGVLKGDWELAWDGIVGIVEGVGSAIASIFEACWDVVGDFLTDLWEDIKGVWNTVATWFDTNVVQPIVEFFRPIVEWISTFFEGCWLIIKAVWVVASTWFNEKVIQPVKKAFDTVCDAVGGFFSDLWEDIKGVWESVSDWFSETIIEPLKAAFEKCCDAIGGFFSNLWLGVKIAAATVANAVITSVEWLINKAIDGINNLVGGFNKVVEWAADVLGTDWGGLSLISKVEFGRIDVPELPKYAEGGFPESGQAFIARENGIPEMVGTIGRRTAVANNEQIVESVASGVAEANGEQNALLREQNSLLRALLEKDDGVYLDGRSLSNSVDKYKREHGRVLITGGGF